MDACDKMGVTMSRRAPYPEAVRAAAVATAIEHGPAEAARRHGVAAATVRQWVKRAGAVTVTHDRMRATVEGVQLSREVRRERLADRLLEIAELSTDKAVAMMEDATLRDVVGLFTRAIHDHQLLSGAATARTEHTGGKDAAHTIADELAARRQKTAA
jgi:transposase-like protein